MTTMPPFAASPGLPQAMSFDPVRFCVMTTVALIAWVLGPPACVMLMSALGLGAYTKAIRGGLRESHCLLRRPWLVLAYLGTAFAGAAVVFVYRLIT